MAIWRMIGTPSLSSLTCDLTINSAAFICSGMFEKNKNLVVAGMKNLGFGILEIRELENWAAIAARYDK